MRVTFGNVAAFGGPPTRPSGPLTGPPTRPSGPLTGPPTRPSGPRPSGK